MAGIQPQCFLRDWHRLTDKYLCGSKQNMQRDSNDGLKIGREDYF